MASVTEELERLAGLLREGLITREQFESKRDRLMAEDEEASVRSTSASSPGVPNQVGAYRILGHIGDGGMGTVYRGKHRSAEFAAKQGGEVAIKVMHPHIARNESFAERFEREAGLGLKLEHPGICKVHELIMDGGVLALVMEIVEGEPLSEIIGSKTGPIPWERAWPMFEQLLGAVAYMHGQGVIHRDIKPENVLVTEAGKLKLLDLGIAKAVGSGKTKTGVGMGTVDYMSPEQHTDAGKVDERADVYALGMTLYEMLAGRLPWGDELDALMVLQKKLMGDIPPPTDFYPSIPPGVVAALMGSLATERDDRTASAAALGKALEAASAQAQQRQAREEREAEEAQRRSEEQVRAEEEARLAATAAARRPEPAPASARARRPVPPSEALPPAAATRRGLPKALLAGNTEREARCHRQQRALAQATILGWVFLLACTTPEPEPAPVPVPVPVQASVVRPAPTPAVQKPTELSVVPRSTWSADAGQGEFVRQSVHHITVHHTAAVWGPGTNGTQRVLQHLKYHRNKGWADIAYHFVIDGTGTVFEGRPMDTVGDTSTNYDPSGHLLVTLEGNFEEQSPTPAQRESMVALLAWASDTFGVIPEDIGAHQDHAATACPGASVLEWIRSKGLAGEVQEVLERGGTVLKPSAVAHFDSPPLEVPKPVDETSVLKGDCVVAVDVGHSKARPGATSARGRPEYAFNWRLANELVDKLRRTQGVDEVFLVDPTEKGLRLKERSARATARGGDLLLSIHHDSVQPHYLNDGPTDGQGRAWSDRFRGHSLFVSMKGGAADESVRLGLAVGEALVAAGRTPTSHHNEAIAGENRDWIDEQAGLYRFDGLAILRTATIPALLVEAGLIVHRAEEAELERQETRAVLVDAIARAVAGFCDSAEGR